MPYNIQPPESVLNILRILKANSFEAYAVGGCIRDSILGTEPKDWDIATNALPNEVKALFAKTIDTGLKHGTVTVVLKDGVFEITTFRIDGRYEDGRHPNQVEFTPRLEDDLRRRDFTINAMAWNEERGIVDPFGGMQDLGARLVRAVGKPEERFREDALRMLRAVRFSTRLGFETERDTLKAICDNSVLIRNISSERIREELTGILTAKNPMKFALLREAGLMKLILPELEACFNTPQHNPHHIYNVGEHSLHAVAAIENEKCLRWTMLLHDTGKAVTWFRDENGIDHYYGHPAKSVEIAEGILSRLKFDKRSMDRILRLIRFHDREIILKRKAVAKAVYTVGEDIFTDLLKVKRADKRAQIPSDIQKGLEYIDSVEKMYIEMKKENDCLDLKDMAVNGNDLMNMGFKEGREVGRVLSKLFERVLENPSINQKKVLEEIAKEMLPDKSGN